MDDDDDIFAGGSSAPPPQATKPPVSNDGDLMGGFSFEPSPPPSQPSQPSANDPFSMMGLDLGGSSQPQPPQSNSGFGGDLLGFGDSPSQPPPQPPSQPPANSGMDLMGFGFSSGPSQPPSSQTNPPASTGGFSFDHSTPQQAPSQPPAQNNNNLGFDMMGTSSQPSQPKPAQQTSGFVPITNTNPNKILAYESPHLQMWMDCIKETNDTTKLFTTYINKTNNTLTNLTIQAAVVKHVKLTINPLTSTTLQPYSKEVVNQVFFLQYRQ